MKFIPLCLALVVTSSWTRVATPAVYAPEVGKRHVDFVLPRIDDRRPWSLSQLRGKKVLLIQFASW